MTGPSPRIAEAALAALQEQRQAEEAFRQQRAGAAVDLGRLRLADLFGEHLDVAALRVAHVDPDRDAAVFTDGDLALTVVDANTVHATEHVDGQWTDVSGPLDLSGIAAWIEGRS